MLHKFARFFEYFYIVAGVFFTYETIVLWNSDRPKAYLFLFFAILAIFMFFFRRNFRRRVEKRMNEK
ncbi:MAG: hypothetical protein GX163_09495 [Bacteroidetes bacterium]|jgi:type II secretory pathway component PulF|nr:hypothetical protein [Bacteroidota bacterium]